MEFELMKKMATGIKRPRGRPSTKTRPNEFIQPPVEPPKLMKQDTPVMKKIKNPSISKLKKDKQKLNDKFTKLQQEYNTMREKYGDDLFNFEKLN